MPISGHALLLALGFKKSEFGIWELDETSSASGGKEAALERLVDAKDTVDCLLMSMDVDVATGTTPGPSPEPSPRDEPMNGADGAGPRTTRAGTDVSMGINPGEDEEDDDLNAALALSLGENAQAQQNASKRNGGNDDDDDMDVDRVEVDFQRFDATDIIVDPKQIEEINHML